MKALTLLFLSLCCLGQIAYCGAQAVDKTDSRMNVFPKRKDIKVDISEKTKEATFSYAFPEGIYPYLSVRAGDENGDKDEYEVLRPFIGKVKKADVYQLDELLGIDFANLPSTEENEWTKLTIAAAYNLKEDPRKSLEVLNTLSDKSKQLIEFLTMRAMCKTLSWPDSALLDIYAIEKKDPKYHMIHLLRGKALTRKRMYESAISEFALALTDIGHHTGDMLYFRSLCNYQLKNYELSFSDIEDLIHSYGDSVPEWRYLRALILAKKENPDYELALEELDYVMDHSDGLYSWALINASIIFSCRKDVDKRHRLLAFGMLEIVDKNFTTDSFIIELTLARTLAHIEFGEFEEASKFLAELKKMYVGTNDIPEMNMIEESILKKRRFIPSHSIPLVLGPR